MRRDISGVSPVIGVILMVAITVVLAAVIFILVNDLGSADSCGRAAEREWDLAVEAFREGNETAAQEHRDRAELYEAFPYGTECPGPEGGSTE